MKKHFSIIAAAALLIALFLLDWAKAMQAVYAFIVLLLGCASVFALYCYWKKTNP